MTDEYTRLDTYHLEDLLQKLSRAYYLALMLGERKEPEAEMHKVGYQLCLHEILQRFNSDKTPQYFKEQNHAEK